MTVNASKFKPQDLGRPIQKSNVKFIPHPRRCGLCPKKFFKTIAEAHYHLRRVHEVSEKKGDVTFDRELTEILEVFRRGGRLD